LQKYTTATAHGRLKLPTQEQTSRKNHEMRDSHAQREEDELSLSLSQESQRASAAIAHSTECSAHLRSGLSFKWATFKWATNPFSHFKPFFFSIIHIVTKSYIVFEFN
jgi:hypothetical protein